MGKWAKYGKRYCKQWEADSKLKDWIQPVPQDSGKAACKFCKVILRAHYNDLCAHAERVKHLRNANPGSNMRTLLDVGVVVKSSATRQVKMTELKFAAHIACHSSIATIDHLGEIVNESLDSSGVSIHRTKCSALIKSVLAPTMREELLTDLRGSKYSLIVDESTDISCEKQLCVLVRYYSDNINRIVTTFLGLISLTSATADSVFKAIQDFLTSNCLCIKDCIGLATDGCNVMCGQNNSVITRFKNINPEIIHIKCICHSLQLCSSYALKTLPRNIEFMISETYSWFAHSTVRQQRYKELYRAINVGEEPLKIIRMSDTRWLSIASCVQRVLDQYDALKLHFFNAKDTERNYTADLLHRMFSDIENKLYLVFLRSILAEVNRVNKLFQSEKCNPVRLLEELVNMYRSVLSRIMHPATFTTWCATLEFDINDSANLLPLNAVYFGAEFHILLEGSKLQPAVVIAIKERCRGYLFELLKEMYKRLPTNISQLQSLSNLSPSIVLSANKPLLHKLSFLPMYCGSVATLDQQWSRLNAVQWPYREDAEIEAFWTDVVNHKDASSTKDFHELGKFILSVLALPFSNAAVERAFSGMNLIKTKQRNRMGQDMLEALMHIRGYMDRHSICCNKFRPSQRMLSKFDLEMYSTGRAGDD